MPTYINQGNYLLIEKFGVYSFKNMLTCLQKIGEQCTQENLNKVFIDLRDLDGSISIPDRYELGKETAKIFGSKIKLAVVGNPNEVNYLAENSAVNRGGNLKVFIEIKDAMEWLEGG